MENPGFSASPSAGVAGVPHSQPRTGNVPFGPGGSTSNNQSVPVSQDLYVPSNSELNHPAGATFINPGIAPPPYSSSDFENHGHKLAPPPYSQEDVIQPHITIVTLEEGPSPCCNHCSWMCWRKTHLALAMIAVCIAIVKIMMLILS